MKRFRGGLVFKAHRLVYDSTIGLRVIKKKRRDMGGPRDGASHGFLGPLLFVPVSRRVHKGLEGSRRVHKGLEGSRRVCQGLECSRRV